MEPEERIILADILACSERPETEIAPAIELFLQAHPGADQLVARLAARLGEPGVLAPDTEHTLRAVRERLRGRGVPLAPEAGEPSWHARNDGAWMSRIGPRPLHRDLVRRCTEGVRQHFVVRHIRNLISEVTNQVLALIHGDDPDLQSDELERLLTLVAQGDDDDDPDGASSV